MAPSVIVDSPSPAQNSGRLLLLSPPSLSSHPEKLNTILSAHARDSTDLQMLDRLALGLVSLPESTYDVVMLLTGADNTLVETHRLISREILQKIVQSLKAGGKLRRGAAGDNVDEKSDSEQTFRNEAILAGLVFDDKGELAKPDSSAQQAVPLKLGRKKKDVEVGSSVVNNGVNSTITASTATNNKAPAGVGFIDFSDDFGTPVVEDGRDEDEELIDEEALLDEDDMGRPIVQPPECRPKAGKRRRACKDCTCGLAQKIEAEDKAKRSNADKALETMKLETNDLAEVDFTVQGKLGSCGNCALGDAFRCDGCPYIGLPAFKPGEEVRLVNNDVQL
ncbi:Fe-S cluster assembly protein DRE2 [Helicocarpus griseus UAMH5409]|uniref:Fe-S cluster assembly protein DRE2 n=1 Tax=Helicocarpus griseus UAMH5409 TaxID=1447875 RepID=A0A2B7Y7H5_9EURO|nr:Fe-S cluster assembly protein DRE2 [Helicocarpus griseus UAMH5409]